MSSVNSAGLSVLRSEQVPCMMGHLDKLRPKKDVGIFLDLWQTRFFVLCTDRMLYFKSNTAFTKGKEALGVVPLAKAWLLRGAGDLEFVLRTPFRDYHLRASSGEDLLQGWMQAFSSVGLHYIDPNGLDSDMHSHLTKPVARTPIKSAYEEGIIGLHTKSDVQKEMTYKKNLHITQAPTSPPPAPPPPPTPKNTTSQINLQSDCCSQLSFPQSRAPPAHPPSRPLPPAPPYPAPPPQQQRHGTPSTPAALQQPKQNPHLLSPHGEGCEQQQQQHVEQLRGEIARLKQQKVASAMAFGRVSSVPDYPSHVQNKTTAKESVGFSRVSSAPVASSEAEAPCPHTQPLQPHHTAATPTRPMSMHDELRAKLAKKKEKDADASTKTLRASAAADSIRYTSAAADRASAAACSIRDAHTSGASGNTSDASALPQPFSDTIYAYAPPRCRMHASALPQPLSDTVYAVHAAPPTHEKETVYPTYNPAEGSREKTPPRELAHERRGQEYATPRDWREEPHCEPPSDSSRRAHQAKREKPLTLHDELRQKVGQIKKRNGADQGPALC